MTLPSGWTAPVRTNVAMALKPPLPVTVTTGAWSRVSSLAWSAPSVKATSKVWELEPAPRTELRTNRPVSERGAGGGVGVGGWGLMPWYVVTTTPANDGPRPGAGGIV